MNKCTLLSIFLLASSIVVVAKDREEREIRKKLYGYYNNGVSITVADLKEAGLSGKEILARDIEMLEDHQKLLIKKLNKQSGFLRKWLIPGCLHLTTDILWMSSIASGLFTFFFSDWTNVLLKNRPMLYFLDIQSRILYDENQKRQYERERLLFIGDKQDRIQLSKGRRSIDMFDHLQEEYGSMSTLAAGNLVIDIVCLIGITSLIKSYPAKIKAYKEKVQKRIDRDQLIIMRLKRLQRA